VDVVGWLAGWVVVVDLVSTWLVVFHLACGVRGFGGCAKG
jgi:hypothetical protein